MADDAPTVNRLKALDLLKNASPGLSPEDRTNLETAIEHDLDTAAASAASETERLEKVEGQVHALSDAVVAIAEPSKPSIAVEGAVQAVKDTM